MLSKRERAFDPVIFYRLITLEDSSGSDLADKSKLFETLVVFLIFFHIYFLETKVLIRLSVCRLVFAFVVCMQQSQISRDKVHMIFKNSTGFHEPFSLFHHGVLI